MPHGQPHAPAGLLSENPPALNFIDVRSNPHEPIYPLVGDPNLGTGSYSLPYFQGNVPTGSVGVDRNFMRTTVRPALGVLGDSPGFSGHGVADVVPFTAPFMAAGDYVARNMNREYVGRPGAQILDLAIVGVPGVLDAALIPPARRAASTLYDRAVGDRLPMTRDELAGLQSRMDAAADVTPQPPAQIAAPKAAAPRQMEPPPLLAADEAPFPNSGTFQTTDNGNLIGYKVMAVEDGKLVSGANSRLSFENAVGANISMPGQGVFFSNNPEYVKSYYAGLADNEVLLKLEVDPKNIKSGNINDVEPEIAASTAKIVGIEPIEPQPLVQYDIDPVGGNPAGLAYFDQGPGISRSADPWVDDAGTPVYPMYYNFRELPDSYAKDKVAQWLGAREGGAGLGWLDDAESEAARRADENDLLRRDSVARGGTPSLQSRVDERLKSVRGSLGAWSLAFDDAGQLKKELSRQDLLEMAEVLVDVLHVGGRGGLDTATRGFLYSNPSFYDPIKVPDAVVQKIPNLLHYGTDSDDVAKIAPGYRQIGINVDNVLAAQDKARTDPRYQSLLPIELGLPDGKPEDLFMYVLTHEMGHTMHESVPRLQQQLQNFPNAEIDPAISLSRVLTNLVSRNSAEEGAVLSRYDAVNLGATMQEEAIKISKKRRPTAWANSEIKDPNFGIRTSEAERMHHYLHTPQELLADVAATMLENPASIRKTEIYTFLKNLFGKGVYKDVIKFGAFGGLTLPQILQMSEQNETQG